MSTKGGSLTNKDRFFLKKEKLNRICISHYIPGQIPYELEI